MVPPWSPETPAAPAIANAPVEMGCAHESSAIGPFLMSASGSNRLSEVGQSMSALFRYCEVNLDAEISDRAFDFGMSEQKLDGPGGSICERELTREP
jgi:hypothetical protein